MVRLYGGSSFEGIDHQPIADVDANVMCVRARTEVDKISGSGGT